VEGVAKDDLRAEAFQFLGRHRFHGAVCAYGHECGRFNYAVRQCQATQPSSAVSCQQFEVWPQPLTLVFVRNIASP
jgi:hypothetical protein